MKPFMPYILAFLIGGLTFLLVAFGLLFIVAGNLFGLVPLLLGILVPAIYLVIVIVLPRRSSSMSEAMIKHYRLSLVMIPLGALVTQIVLALTE